MAAPLSAPVYASAAQLAQYPGPQTLYRYAIVETLGLFKWYPSDTTSADNTTVIAPSGGSAGRWKLSAAWPGASAFFTVDGLATSSITLSGEQTIDGVAYVAGDVILPTAQNTASENVPWTVSAGAWTRPTWYDSNADAFPGQIVSVQRGTNNGGTLWRMSSPTSGSVTLGTTSISWQQLTSSGVALPSNATLILPSGDTTGVTDRAAIQAALTAGRLVYLVAGAVYYIDQELTFISGARLVCLDPSKSAIVRTASTWAPANGSADDRTIAMFRIVSTIGAVSTTLTAISGSVGCFKGQRQINFGSATGWSAGVVGLIGPGSNVGGDATDMSDGASVSIGEVFTVESMASTWATLQEPILGHHKSAKTVRNLSTAITDVEIRGIHFDAEGKNIPVGIRCDYAQRVRIIGCTFEDFSRAGVDCLISKDIQIEDCTFLGGINAGVIRDSCQRVSTYRARRPVHSSARQHEQGNPRPFLFTRNRCIECHDIDFELHHVNIGVGRWGGWHCKTRGVVTDADPSALKSRNAEYSGHTSGCGYEGGPGILSVAEFSMDETVEIDVSECRANEAVAVLSPYAIYLHDSFQMKGRASFVNKGVQYAASINSDGTYDINGINMQDIGGSMDLRVVGCGYNARLGGTFVALTGTFAAMGAAGGGAADGFGIYVDCAGDFSMPRWSQVTVTNCGVFVGFGANWDTNPDAYFSWADCQFGSNVFSDVMWCYTTATVVVGVLYKIDATSPAGTVAQRRRMIASAGAGDKSMVCATVKSGNNALFAPLPGRKNVVYMTAATNFGDLLKNNGAGEAAVDNAVTLAGGYIGRCLIPRSGAGFSLVGT